MMRNLKTARTNPDLAAKCCHGPQNLTGRYLQLIARRTTPPRHAWHCGSLAPGPATGPAVTILTVRKPRHSTLSYSGSTYTSPTAEGFYALNSIWVNTAVFNYKETFIWMTDANFYIWNYEIDRHGTSVLLQRSGRGKLLQCYVQRRNSCHIHHTR